MNDKLDYLDEEQMRQELRELLAPYMDMSVPPPAPDELIAVARSGRQPQRVVARQAERRRFLLLALLSATAVLTALLCLWRRVWWLSVPALVIALPALCQAAGSAYRLYLHRQLRDVAQAPTRYCRYLDKLSESEARGTRRRSRWARLFSRHGVARQTFFYRTTGAALACCLLLTLALSLPGLQPVGAGPGEDLQYLLSTAQYSKLMCNVDCDTNRVLTETFQLVHYV